MAITRTQIAKQLLAKGGRIGFFTGAQADASAGKGSMSPGTSGTGGMRGGNGGGRDRDFQQRGMSKADYAKSKQTQNFGGQREDKTIKDFINNYVKDRQKLAYNLSSFIPGQKKRSATMQKAYRDYLIKMGVTPPDTLTGEEDDLAEFFVENAFDKPVAADAMLQTPQSYGEFIAENFGAPGVMMSGNVGGLEKFVKEDGTFGYRNVGGGEGSNILLPQMMAQAPSITEQELSPIELALKQRDEMGGARAFAKEGGIMDLETGRQMYLFGKLVKKAKKIVGKITKSPIGKAALLAAPFAFPSARGAISSFFGKGSFNPFMAKGKFSGLGSILNKAGLVSGTGGLTGLGKLAGGAALTAAPLLFQKDDTEDEYAEFLRRTGKGPSIDIQGIRNDPYSVLARGFYAEGGKPEPVAKKTMPLLDMGGQEMDLRAEGGFVPIGRMEKADDVPARLSKNEFVFTADAVRNAGDGNVDKGAEVMYNMMKNLEAGGEVSEESQGLKGARKMFQTSQRLEEVL